MTGRQRLEKMNPVEKGVSGSRLHLGDVTG
jgi:hypothetical protein